MTTSYQIGEQISRTNANAYMTHKRAKFNEYDDMANSSNMADIATVSAVATTTL